MNNTFQGRLQGFVLFLFWWFLNCFVLIFYFF